MTDQERIDQLETRCKDLEEQTAWCKRGLLYLLKVMKANGISPDGKPVRKKSRARTPVDDPPFLERLDYHS